MPTALLIDGPMHNQSFGLAIAGKEVHYPGYEQDAGRYVLDSFHSQPDGSTVVSYKWQPDPPELEPYSQDIFIEENAK
jgi:hypothetical protein